MGLDHKNMETDLESRNSGTVLPANSEYDKI